MSKATVYTLTNPLTNQPYYVGVTTRLISARLTQHTKTGNTNKTTGRLVSAGLMPIIEAIESCSNNEMFELEEYWIHQLKSWGFKLENKNKLRQNSSIRKVRKTPIKKLEIVKKEDRRRIVRPTIIKNIYNTLPPF